MSNDTELLHASVIKRIWKKCKEEDMDIVAFAWRIQREAERAATPSAPTAVEPDERAVTVNDVYTLFGHADILIHKGEVDMPQYLHELAVRLAEQVGDPWLINRAKTLAARASKGTPL